MAFRDGVTLAGALMLDAPHRFAGAVLLYGALPFDAGVPMTRGRLAGMPVFLAHGADDVRTPARLLARTWDWLAERERRAAVGRARARRRAAGGQGRRRRRHLARRPARPSCTRTARTRCPTATSPRWPTLPARVLPARSGRPPAVTTGIPQHQLSQNAPPHLQAQLWARLAALDAVSTAPATVGVAGTRALLLDRDAVAGPDAAFVLPADGEFAHMHPEPDGSLHVVLPDELAYDALAKGWAVAHPLAGVRVSPGMVLVPGPRDAAEVEIVAGIAAASHRYATG